MNDSLNEQYYIQEHHNFNISLGSSIEKIHPIFINIINLSNFYTI